MLASGTFALEIPAPLLAVGSQRYSGKLQGVLANKNEASRAWLGYCCIALFCEWAAYIAGTTLIGDRLPAASTASPPLRLLRRHGL